MRTGACSLARGLQFVAHLSIAAGELGEADLQKGLRCPDLWHPFVELLGQGGLLGDEGLDVALERANLLQDCQDRVEVILSLRSEEV